MDRNLAASVEDPLENPAPDGIRPSRFSLKQRFSLWLTSLAGYLAIRLIGPTLRISITYEPGAEDEPRTRPSIFCFWHRCVFPAAYVFRNKGIRVLTSRSYDGEYIARIINRLGFRAVRGSSSRGAVQSLRELQRELENREFVAFTIDGPRGPRYVAKPGPIHLARVTGAPIFSFYVAVERAWILRTWDAFVLPKPFSRIHCVIRAPIRVAADSNHEQSLAQMQSELEAAQRSAESPFVR